VNERQLTNNNSNNIKGMTVKMKTVKTMKMKTMKTT